MYIRKPDWLKVKIVGNENTNKVKNMIDRLGLNTVCTEANCPNKMECFERSTATFMILGTVCTRNCTFCNVTKGTTEPINSLEPQNISKAVQELSLKHVVITSVTRDDLPDGGAKHFSDVIKAIKETTPKVTIEVLIPDFKGDEASLRTVISAKPDIINHNVETVPSLYSKVRPMAQLERSLMLLQRVKELDATILTKSGMMVGLGETMEEVEQLLTNLKAVGCNIVTIGQYMAPSSSHTPVIEYIHPDIFKQYKSYAEALGFDYVASSPLVRSSYHADEAIN